MCGVVDVEEFSLEREDATVVATDHGQAGHDQCLGRVPLGDDAGTAPQPGGPGAVGVVQLGDAGEFGLHYPTLALEDIDPPVLSVRHDGVHHTQLLHELEELVGELDRGERGEPDGHIFLCLDVKGGVLHEAVDEYFKMVLDLPPPSPPFVLFLMIGK